MAGLIMLKAEDTVLLNAHIKMIPKIMALDTRISTKTAKTPAILAIVYEGNRKRIARQIADEITSYYNGKVANVYFNAVVLSVDELFLRQDISFVYVTTMGESSVRKIGTWCMDNTIPSFSYDVSDIENGILGSIAIERSTVIYINKPVFKKGKFRFNDSLLQIVRLIE